MSAEERPFEEESLPDVIEWCETFAGNYSGQINRIGHTLRALSARPTTWAYEQACRAVETHTESERQYFRWAYQLLLALAKRHLKDHQNDRGEWPCDQEWEGLVGTSHSIFMGMARREAGIDDDAFLEPIRAGRIDVEDLYQAAASGRVPSSGSPPK